MSVTLRLHEDDAQVIAKALDAMADIAEIVWFHEDPFRAAEVLKARKIATDRPGQHQLRRLSAAFATAVRATVKET